ncbi:hypothetical protein NDU88_007515 [Pleurodeles waltl]|uniref:Uncharacterized protein n=1 Tax=Pleurodeles waltl TaxID=8319 RepID=A0AAV7QMB9_PLEWA|nr:hypothetical protein NDU88_007515 [Pleurodeles waltl]
MGHWAGPVFGSVRLGRLQAAESHVLCFQVTVSSRLRRGEAGAVALVCRRRDDAHLHKLIYETLLELQVVPPVVAPAGAADSRSSSLELEGPSPEEEKCKSISRDLLPPMVKHVKVNMDFPEDEVPDTSSGSLLRQFQSTVPVDMPIHSCIQEVIKRRTSLAEDAVIRDAVDKNVDVSLKKAYSGTHLALRARIYGTYFAQSLLSDLKALNSALDWSSDCLGLESLIERQVELLSDISFDDVRAMALPVGACLRARNESSSQGLENRCSTKSFSTATPFPGQFVVWG